MAEKYLTNSDFNKALPKETADRYKVVGMTKRNSLRVSYAKFGLVDFRSLSLKHAEHLYNQKFPYLEKKAQNKAGKSAETDEPSA